MKNFITKLIIHTISIVISFTSFVIIMNYISEPYNYPFKFDPSEAFSAYFFSFSYGLGTVGIIFGIVILLTTIAVITLLTNWIYNKLYK